MVYIPGGESIGEPTVTIRYVNVCPFKDTATVLPAGKLRESLPGPLWTDAFKVTGPRYPSTDCNKTEYQAYWLTV
jgi:hypothetical protein